ncbi:3'(2'),5'-bisphosphate nucleotidase CysQ [Hoeflea sp. YIM 152468]|uniref:3'(2'),5'-bisphosphate nucleotidase CysQ n=1 Tax=Hoeflea sp. YIM 152468 TaxID=3031759 RepID=UPI0023DAC8F0|nr:3'(2'),5'-bisphosphate nucleotidase CysQ [Hoeflea sp. YIM 152468]MDF1608502.1 3'(2'),5'-bisphosphate nucleotidase CysQ [Hoeflea sp. YIM 152468]
MGAFDVDDPSSGSARALVRALEKIAVAAGKEIMAVRAAGATVTVKSDHTPVTQADQRAESLILDHLTGSYPDIPVIAEELAESGKCPSHAKDMFFLVDALDGTGDFIAGRNEFTVNIALIRGHAPAAGVVYAPALGKIWSGVTGHAEVAGVSGEDEICDRRRLHTRQRPEVPLALLSVSHREPETEAWLERLPLHRTAKVGSSLKFCLLAEGSADIYPRLVCLKQWDIAAGDAVLRAAGGMTLTLDGQPLRYGVEGANFGCERFVGWGQAPDG